MLCKGCGDEFTPKDLRQKYRKPSCRESYYKTKDLGNGVKVKGNRVSIRGAANIIKFFAGY